LKSNCQKASHRHVNSLSLEKTLGCCGPCHHRFAERLRCDLKNDKGRWRLSTPGKATVINDTSQLEISCKAPFIPSFKVSVMPMPSMGMLGNLLFGGVVGAAVDVYNNSGMKYPENIYISNPNCK